MVVWIARHESQKVLQQSLQVLANGGWMNVDSALDAAVRFFADGIMHSIFTDERDLGFLLPLCHIHRPHEKPQSHF